MTISWPVCTLRDGPPDPVTVKPRMYSETIALALHHDRTRFEVMLDPVASPDGRAFRPHMLIRNDTDGADMDRMGDVRWSVEVLCSDGMDARVSLDGKEIPRAAFALASSASVVAFLSEEEIDGIQAAIDARHEGRRAEPPRSDPRG